MSSQVSSSTLPLGSATASSTTSTVTSTYTPITLSTFPPAPLTTTFTPPSQCVGFYVDSNGITVFGESSTCLPSGFGAAPTSYFSPGFSCPEGYHTACHDSKGVSSITTVTCCPSYGDILLSCVDPSTRTVPGFESLFCTWVAPESSTTILITESNHGTTSTVTGTAWAPDGVNALGVRSKQIQWQ
jgi:hypothetical protein